MRPGFALISKTWPHYYNLKAVPILGLRLFPEDIHRLCRSRCIDRGLSYGSYSSPAQNINKLLIVIIHNSGSVYGYTSVA